MKITVKGRNFSVTDELRDCVDRRFEKVGKQVSELATLEVELSRERNPGSPNKCVADATLYLKGVTLRAREASPDMVMSIHRIADEMAVQVKRHRDRRRARRSARAGAPAATPLAADALPFLDAPDAGGGATTSI